MMRSLRAIAALLVGCSTPSTVAQPDTDAGPATAPFFDQATATPGFGALVDVKEPSIIGAGSTRLFFTASSTSTPPGALCWVSDGTRAGTRPVMPPKPVLLGRSVIVNDRLVFAGAESEQGLWSTDGTTEGTTQLALSKRTDSSVFSSKEIDWLLTSDNRAWMLLDDGVLGPELYVTDGTPAGTKRLTDDLPVPAQLKVTQLIPIVGGVALRVTEPKTGAGYPYHFWVSDGTRAGTHHVKQELASYGFSNAQVSRVGNRVFFVYDTVAEGEEIWVWNGTSAAMIPVSPGSSSSEPNDAWALGDRFLFAASEPIGPGLYVVENNGSTATRVSGARLHPIKPFVGQVGSLLTFAVSENASDSLWATDGTVAGTRALKTMEVDPSRSGFGVATLGGRLVFPGKAARNGPLAPWVTDGTPEGTKQLLPTYGRDLMGPVILDGIAWGIAQTHVDGFQLYRTDGTLEGSRVVTAPGATNVSNALGAKSFGTNQPLASPTPMGHNLFFVANYFGKPQLFRFDPSGGIDSLTAPDAGLSDPTCQDVPTSYIGEVQFDTMCAAAVCYRRTSHVDRALAVCASMAGFVGPSPLDCPGCR